MKKVFQLARGTRCALCTFEVKDGDEVHEGVDLTTAEPVYVHRKCALDAVKVGRAEVGEKARA